MAMERMMGVGYPPSVGKFRNEQIAQQSTWTVVPDEERVNASMTIKHIIPSNASTTTYVNDLQPANGGHYERPGSYDRVHRAGIWR